MHDATAGEREERIQRALNDARTQDLTDRFGATADEPEEDIPAEVEADRLDCVETLKTQLPDTGEIGVRAYVGYPRFRPLESVPQTRLADEVERVLEYLHDRQVNVEFLAEVSDTEAYRFLTGELLDQRMENIRIDGLFTCFIYEHFHPNDRYDASEVVKDFLWRLFGRRTDGLTDHLSRHELRDAAGKRIPFPAMKQTVEEWVAGIALFTTHIVRVQAVLVDGDDAVVRAEVRWSGLASGTLLECSGAGEALFSLRRRNRGGFEVVQMEIPGFDAERERPKR